ncbi:MAG: hypothetical protein DIU70_011595 [Bacillota bacterium]|nr:MAG: hypothetical protein DIU70_07505 [Bacillota bacterium]
MSGNGRRLDAIEVDWEHVVPLADVQEARISLAEELAAYYHAPVDELTDLDVARYLVRVQGLRYLRPGLSVW